MNGWDSRIGPRSCRWAPKKGLGRPYSSAVNPDARTTGAQRSISDLIVAAKPAGVLCTDSMAASDKPLRTSASCSAALNQPAISRTLSGGVLAGTRTPTHVSMSIAFNPLSTSVGTSGKKRLRRAVVVASTRTRPLASCGITSPIVLMLTETSPDMRACKAGAPPLYGTCSSSAPIALDSIRPMKCDAAPADVEAKDAFFGLALHHATNWAKVVTLSGSPGPAETA